MRKILLFSLAFMQVILALSLFAAAAEFSHDAFVKVNDKVTFSLIGSEADTIAGKGISADKKKDGYFYYDVLDGMDIKYTTSSKKIKEEIILKKKPKFDKILFKLDINGSYDFKKDAQEIEIYFSDDFRILTGVFRRPFYTHNGKNYSLNASFDSSTKTYSIDLAPLRNLKENDYPIIIDPTYDGMTGECESNATTINCTGTITGNTVNTAKNIVLTDVTWSVSQSGCGTGTLYISSTKDLIFTRTSITVGCSCSGVGTCGTSTTLYANNSYFYGTTITNSGNYGTPYHQTDGGDSYITAYVNRNFLMNASSMSASGGVGFGANSCLYTEGGGSGDIEIYASNFTSIASSLTSSGGAGGYSPCRSGSAYIRFYYYNFGNSNFYSDSKSSFTTNTGGTDCPSLGGDNYFAINDFYNLYFNSTAALTPEHSAYIAFNNLNFATFFSGTSISSYYMDAASGRNITLNGTDSKFAWFGGKVTGNYKLSVAHPNINNLTTGIMNAGDDTKNLTISNYYNTVPYPAYFVPDYMNISLVPKSLNYTSEGGQICGYNGTSYIQCMADYESPSFSLGTYNPAICKLWNEPKNWTALNNASVPDCGYSDGIPYAEGGRNHSCNFSSALFDGLSTLYLSCKSFGYESGNNFTSNKESVFNITVAKTFTAMNAIALAINSSVNPSDVKMYNARLVYERTKNNSQRSARFDRYVSYKNQRWAFNYISLNESPIGNFYNISDVFYFLEMRNITTANIKAKVSALINSTMS